MIRQDLQGQLNRKLPLTVTGRIVERGSHLTAQSGLVENLQRWGAGKIIQLGNRTTVEHRTERLKQPESGLKIKNGLSLNFPSGS